LVDILTPEVRSALMSRIRAKDTRPEIAVRRIVHALGFRYRLHCRDLPGTPDLVFRRMRKIIFVHGCFWHRHDGCPKAYKPKSRQSFWRKKFRLNKQRDRMHIKQLTQDGWDVMVIWECELESLKAVTARIGRFLNRGKLLSIRRHA
jgi:DNA mismatch endonuclease, patch repair protein